MLYIIINILKIKSKKKKYLYNIYLGTKIVFNMSNKKKKKKKINNIILNIKLFFLNFLYLY